MKKSASKIKRVIFKTVVISVLLAGYIVNSAIEEVGKVYDDI